MATQLKGKLKLIVFKTWSELQMPCIDSKVVAVSPSQRAAIQADPGTDPETIASITSKYNHLSVQSQYTRSAFIS